MYHYKICQLFHYINHLGIAGGGQGMSPPPASPKWVFFPVLLRFSEYIHKRYRVALEHHATRIPGSGPGNDVIRAIIENYCMI